MHRRGRIFLIWLLAASAGAFADEVPHFGREILPLLSDRCLACHGPDEVRRQAGLRLDTREGALARHQGVAAVVPGDPGSSALLNRVRSTDPEEVMPPPKSHQPPLSAEEVSLLERWIRGGAPWGVHWAFERPVKAPLPRGEARHPIDAFVRARLAQEGLSPSPEASRSTLARRLAFDLTGLPPAPDAVAAFLADAHVDAYERYVDTLLASPHFGERLAMWWLDAARYADTDGFQGDATRSNWPWRDWVVAAFNANLPFDQFTREQFGGDLLPGATPEQKLATCFHRNHMTNGEGGRDPEESRVDYVLDRVNTIGTVWLGLTLNCVQCHTHKFDPITQTEYYRLAAFFDSIDENGQAGSGAKPYLNYRSANAAPALAEAQALLESRRRAETMARQSAEAAFEGWLGEQASVVRPAFRAWRVLVPSALSSAEGSQLVGRDDGSIVARGPNPPQDDYRVMAPLPLARLTGLKLEVLPDPEHTGGKFSRGKSGEFILTDIKVQVRRRGSAQVRDLTVGEAVADTTPAKKEERDYGDIKGVLDDDPRNGWTTRDAEKVEPHVAVFALAEPQRFAPDEELIFELKQRSTLGDANIGRFRLSVTDQAGPAIHHLEPAPLERLAATTGDVARLEPSLRASLLEQFLADHGPYRAARAALERAQRQFDELQAAARELPVMVLAEREQPRTTHVLVRGVWDRKGDAVTRGVLASVGAPPLGADESRLALAEWIVAKENPLPARVLVNNLWAMLFGAGLVRTQEDFGRQGERPSHPELLDWLAVDVQESGWDLKHLLRRMVTSATYRQDSRVREDLRQRDPENRLLARGARFRLPAWMLRDAALAVSGLLNPAVGGPPVRPYQPEGVWEELFMGRFPYEPSEGAAQYRRTLYAFWRRSIAPTFLFDSAQRRTCEVRLPRTNTPQQALTLLNDRTMLLASVALAQEGIVVRPDAEERLRWLFERVLARTPGLGEFAVLRRTWTHALERYSANPGEADRFLDGLGASEVGRPVETAAATLVASLLLNLDEAITHE